MTCAPPDSFTLQHSDVPQPKLLDIPVVTDVSLPMPSTHPVPAAPVILGLDLGLDLGHGDTTVVAFIRNGHIQGHTTITGEQP